MAGAETRFHTAALRFAVSQSLRDGARQDPVRLDLGDADVNGQTCRALAFVERDIDWQIWIANGPRPTPCKLLITYKTEPSQPQFQAVFSNWDFAPRIDPAVFTPELPPGTEKVPFATAATAK
jgi:hypothetical protein